MISIKMAFHIWKSKFLESDKMFSFLYFLNANLKNRAQTMKCLTQVMDEMGKRSSYQVEYAFLDSNGLDKKYEEIKLRYLETGYKVFIITPYQTLGTGVNLQYQITQQNVHYYPSLREKVGGSKDYDGIYLSKPTQIFPSLNGVSATHESAAKIIYALEYLRAKDYIKDKLFEDNLEAVFRTLLLNEKHNVNLGPYRNYRAICYGGAKTLVQAIGRICRRAYKGEQIHVYYEAKNGEYLIPILRELKGRNNNYEFDILLKDLEEQSREAAEAYENIDKMRKINQDAKNYIDGIMGWNTGRWTQKQIRDWKRLREFVLKYPTFNEGEHTQTEKYYFRFPGNVYLYTYDQGWDLQVISNHLTKYRMEVSMFTGGAYWALEKIEGLKDFFVDRGYAIEFKPNPFILSPQLFQRIYKGAVGEVIGEFLFEKFEIPLKAIMQPEYFEVFDFQIGDTASYVDFKNWHPDFERSEEEELRKVEFKASQIGAERVYLVNNLYQGFDRANIYKRNGIKIITISWLFNTYTCEVNYKAFAQIKESVNRQS